MVGADGVLHLNEPFSSWDLSKSQLLFHFLHCYMPALKKLAQDLLPQELLHVMLKGHPSKEWKG